MLKKLIKNLLASSGYTVRRTANLYGHGPASATRPVGVLNFFLEDIRARGFVPRGIVDIGANRGDWANLALSIFPDTPILMIEPQDEMEPFLSRIARVNPNRHFIKAGVGRRDGELVQTIWEDYAGSSFLPVSNPGLERAGRQRKTRIVTIDGLLTSSYSHFMPDLVKLDIQGFELEALAGGETLFDKTEMFIIEVSLFQFISNWPMARDVISYMAARHYEIYDIPGVARRPCDGALGQMDLTFVKTNGSFRKVQDW